MAKRGRPSGWTKGYSEKRARRQLVAHDTEWQLIKKFADLVKRGNKKICAEFLERQNF